MVAAAAPALGPGEAMLPVRGGHIWYRRSGTGTGTPMVLVHGGPGAGSFYLKPFEAIGDDRPIIRYDQLGAGKSDRLTDTLLMVIPRFVEELDSLRRALRIDKWIVNGQSWGTVLALEYYKAHPEHVAAIIFGGSVFDWRAYARETNEWTKQMSDSAQRAIAKWKKDGIADSPAFKAATDEFYSKFVWRRPIKADLDSTTATFGAEQYVYMQGEYEYVVTGTMKDYDQTAFLPKIKVPVLSVTGEFDEVGPKTVEKHARMIPGAKFVLYKDAGHVTSWDAREANVKDAREFAKSVDKPAGAQADPFVGTWTLNVAKSTYTPGPAPKNQVSIYAAVEGGYHVTTTGTDGAGKPIKTEYSAKLDGKDNPVTGNADYDMASLKRTDAHTLAITRKKAGKVVQTGTIVLSADGKTRTVTVDGTNASGVKIHTVALYDKK